MGINLDEFLLSSWAMRRLPLLSLISNNHAQRLALTQN